MVESDKPDRFEKNGAAALQKPVKEQDSSALSDTKKSKGSINPASSQ